MKVRDFIKWLETQDQDAEVHVLVQDAPGICGEQQAVFEPFDPTNGEHYDHIDLRENTFRPCNVNELRLGFVD